MRKITVGTLMAIVAIGIFVNVVPVAQAKGPKPTTLGQTLQQVCDQQKKLAQNEGVTKFSCSADPLSTSGMVDTTVAKSRKVQVTFSSDPNQYVKVEAQDTQVTVAATSPAKGAAATTNAVVGFPYQCYWSVCHVTLRNTLTLGAWGINCAYMDYVQQYDVYFPYRVVLSVQQPDVSRSDSWGLCTEKSKSTGFETVGLPFWGETWGDICWSQQILPKFITIRTQCHRMGAQFWGDYSYTWIGG